MVAIAIMVKCKVGVLIRIPVRSPTQVLALSLQQHSLLSLVQSFLRSFVDCDCCYTPSMGSDVEPTAGQKQRQFR